MLIRLLQISFFITIAGDSCATVTASTDNARSTDSSMQQLTEAEEYRDMVEREKILVDIDEDLPAPVFDKPSNLMVWVRSGGIYILCKILDGKEWLLRKYQNIMREFKVVKNTL